MDGICAACARCRHQLHRHRRRLLRGPVGGDHRPGAAESRRRRATTWCSPPRCSARWARARTTRGASRGHIMDAVKASLKRLQPTTSTSTRSTASTPSRRSRRRCARSTTWCSQGHGALHRRLELGGLADRQGARHRPSGTAGAGSTRCRPTTPSPAVTSSARSCRCCRARARADGVEPAGRRPADRQVRPRRQRPRAAPAPPSTFRRSTKTAPTTCIDVMRGDRRGARASRVARVALAWLLHQPAVTSVIIGAKRAGAARRQPRRDERQAHRRGARDARRGQRAAARVSRLDAGAAGRGAAAAVGGQTEV